MGTNTGQCVRIECIALVISTSHINPWASPTAQLVKKMPASAGDARDRSSVPGSERSPGEGNGNLLQYSCLENSIDRRGWRVTVHGIANSRTRLIMHTQMLIPKYVCWSDELHNHATVCT